MFKNITLDIYGGSHDRYIGCTITGLQIGYQINLNNIKRDLVIRQGDININTSRVEENEIIFLQGVVNNQIIADKVSFVIENKNIRPKNYMKGIIRPAHGDYIGYMNDGLLYQYEGGGRYSGRLTTLYVIIGTICESLTSMKVYGQLKQVGEYVDQDITTLSIAELTTIDPTFPIFNQKIKQEVYQYIKDMKKDGDSVGALTKFRIINPVFGLGGYDFDSFESQLSANLFAIGAIKGINFGLSYDYVTKPGSSCNGELHVHDGQVFSPINCGGGINGGFTNGYEDIIFECIIRPTPSIFKPQNTIKLTQDGFENIVLNLEGRHDTLIANRIIQVIKAMTYITLYDMTFKK